MLLSLECRVPLDDIDYVQYGYASSVEPGNKTEHAALLMPLHMLQ